MSPNVQAKVAFAVLIATLMALYAHGAKIVVSCPAYNVVLQEAFPNAEVILLTKGVPDPHGYQLAEQDVQLLKSLGPGDVVIFSDHAPFEKDVAKLVQQGEIKAKYIELAKLLTYLT